MQNREIVLALLIGSIAFISLGISAKDEGWAVGEVKDAAGSGGYGPWAPTMDIKVWLGWYNSTSEVTSQYAPGKGIKVDSEGAKTFGLVSVLFFGTGVSLAACVMALTLLPNMFPSLAPLEEVYLKRGVVAAGGLVCLMSILLYAVLAYGTNAYFKDKFEVPCVPRPDWAWGVTMVGGLMLGAAGHYGIDLPLLAPAPVMEYIPI